MTYCGYLGLTRSKVRVFRSIETLKLLVRGCQQRVHVTQKFFCGFARILSRKVVIESEYLDVGNDFLEGLTERPAAHDLDA